MADPRNEFISHVVKGKSFIDTWRGNAYCLLLGVN